jgi:hypothetical protein
MGRFDDKAVLVTSYVTGEDHVVDRGTIEPGMQTV